ncbi:MAG TPA: DUF6134 family protein [Telmatospirillum sp.]|nr:DUF6134 family protein [Telmatospirillum sp.]
MVLRLIAALSILLIPLSALAGEPLSYVILKEGEPIGHETVAITQDGDLTTVEVQTKTRVKVLFLDFHYDHRRIETWRGGRLQQMVADTDDDGAIHHIDLVRDGAGIRLTLDGVVKEMPADALPLSLWGKGILESPILFGVSDAAIYHVATQPMGVSTVVRRGAEVAAERYRIAGDVERDLWYGSDGRLLKTAFERRGYPIEIVRE